MDITKKQILEAINEALLFDYHINIDCKHDFQKHSMPDVEPHLKCTKCGCFLYGIVN